MYNSRIVYHGETTAIHKRATSGRWRLFFPLCVPRIIPLARAQPWAVHMGCTLPLLQLMDPHRP